MAEESPNRDLPEDLARLDRHPKSKAECRTFAALHLGPPRALRFLGFFALTQFPVELVSALAVGLGIGWLFDEWLDTRPWLMLVGIVFGGAAGILNVYRMAAGFGYSVGYRKDNADAGKPPGDDQGTGTIG